MQSTFLPHVCQDITTIPKYTQKSQKKKTEQNSLKRRYVEWAERVFIAWNGLRLNPGVIETVYF